MNPFVDYIPDQKRIRHAAELEMNITGFVTAFAGIAPSPFGRAGQQDWITFWIDCAELAASKAGDELPGRMELLLDAMEDGLPADPRLDPLHQQCMELIFRFALDQWWLSFTATWRVGRFELPVNPYELEAAMASLRAVRNAIERNDTVSARDAMRDHFGRLAQRSSA